MRILNPTIDLEAFFFDVANAVHRLLLTDYDGTLAPFQIDRNNAAPYPGVLDALARIIETECRVALVSGRGIDDLTQLLDLERLPEIWGCHGWERRRADGTHRGNRLETGVKRGLADAYRWAENENLASRCERKPYCLAFHWRGLDAGSIRDLRARVGLEWGTIARSRGLAVHEFDGGIELRHPGKNKGDAVRQMLDEAGTGSVAVYLGDDTTDEDAFRAMRPAGLGILVNAVCRPTAADVWLEPPGELLWFLRRWAAACGGGNERIH